MGRIRFLENNAFLAIFQQAGRVGECRHASCR
jgi:hypothetical protein